MSAVPRKLRTLAWFLRRPALYPQLARELRAEARRPFASDDQAEHARWCEERAIDSAKAIERITGSAPSYRVEDRFAEEFAGARERIERARAAEPADMPPAGYAALDLVYWLAEHLRAERVFETGVAYGWSALVFLLSMRDRAGAHLVSTDIPLQRTTGAYIGCAVPEDLRAQWTLLEGLDRKVLPSGLQQLGEIDLCHYDSDKTYEGRAWAYPRLWAALRPGGIFVSDDVEDNTAFREFARDVGMEPVIAASRSEHHTKYVGVLSKNG